MLGVLMVIESYLPHSTKPTVLEVDLAPSGQVLTLKAGGVSDKFGPIVIRDLEKIWGAPRLSSSGFKSDPGCTSGARGYRIKTEGKVFEICKNEKALTRVSEFFSAALGMLRR